MRRTPAPRVASPGPVTETSRQLRADVTLAPARLTATPRADPATVRPAWLSVAAAAAYASVSTTTIRRA